MNTTEAILPDTKIPYQYQVSMPISSDICTLAPRKLYFKLHFIKGVFGDFVFLYLHKTHAVGAH